MFATLAGIWLRFCYASKIPTATESKELSLALWCALRVAGVEIAKCKERRRRAALLFRGHPVTVPAGVFQSCAGQLQYPSVTAAAGLLLFISARRRCGAHGAGCDGAGMLTFLALFGAAGARAEFFASQCASREKNPQPVKWLTACKTRMNRTTRCSRSYFSQGAFVVSLVLSRRVQHHGCASCRRQKRNISTFCLL